MTLQRLPNGSVLIAKLDEWHLDSLRMIPKLADPGDDENALRRVFPAPFTEGEATPEQQEDWVEYVQPDLETLFEGSIERLAKDVKKARYCEPEDGEEEDEEEDEEDSESESHAKSSRGPTWEITVPADHVDDWFRAMNQARLVLSSSKEAHRTDNEYVSRMLANGELEVLVRYEMLTALCGWWVEVAMRGNS